MYSTALTRWDFKPPNLPVDPLSKFKKINDITDTNIIELLQPQTRKNLYGLNGNSIARFLKSFIGYHIHWLIVSDSILFVITMYRRCILCMCMCVVIIQLFRLPYVNKSIVS